MSTSLTSADVARTLGCSLTTVEALAQRGQLRGIKTESRTGAWSFTAADVALFVESESMPAPVPVALLPPEPVSMLAADIHVPCPCGDRACRYLDEAPVCDLCGRSRLDGTDGTRAGAEVRVYQVGRRTLCLGCLKAEESGKRQRVAS